MSKAIVFQNFPNQHKDYLQIDHFASHVSATTCFFTVEIAHLFPLLCLGHNFFFFCKESWPLSLTKRVHLDNINLYVNNSAFSCSYANTQDQVIANSHFFSFKTLEE